MRLLKGKQFLYHIIAKTKLHYMQNGSRKKNEMHCEMEHLLKRLILQKVDKPMMLTSQKVDKLYILSSPQQQVAHLPFNLPETSIRMAHCIIQPSHLYKRMMMAVKEAISR